MHLKTGHAKRLLLGFWGTWSLLVFSSNLSDALATAGLFSDSIAFRSGNLEAIQSVIGVYSFPGWIGVLMFVAVIVWDLANGTLLWRAALSRNRGGEPSREHVNTAFIVAIALWAAMMIADEFFLSFKVGQFEGTHRSIFIGLVVSYGFCLLTPDRHG